MLNWIDRLAGWWLDMRLNWRIRHDPEFEPMQVEQLEVGNGRMRAILSHSVIGVMAQEAADLLEAAGAENYFSFEVMPRADRGMRNIKVTLQYADKLSPEQKAADLEKKLRDCEGGYNKMIQRVIAFASQLQAWGHDVPAKEILDEILLGEVNAPDYYDLKRRLTILEKVMVGCGMTLEADDESRYYLKTAETLFYPKPDVYPVDGELK